MRILAVIAVALAFLFSAGFLLHDDSVLFEEPTSQTIPTGQIVRVMDWRCDWGEVLAITGSVPGVPRERECTDYPAVRYFASASVRFVQEYFGKLYVLLAVIGTVFAGVAAITTVVRYLKTPEE